MTSKIEKETKNSFTKSKQDKHLPGPKIEQKCKALSEGKPGPGVGKEA